MDEKLEKTKMHVLACAVCSRAAGRVNDFCEEGQLLFLEWAQDRRPLRITEVELSHEQYTRLVGEANRRRRQADRN